MNRGHLLLVICFWIYSSPCLDLSNVRVGNRGEEGVEQTQWVLIANFFVSLEQQLSKSSVTAGVVGLVLAWPR